MMNTEQAQKLIEHYYLEKEVDNVPSAVVALCQANMVHGQPPLPWLTIIRLRRSVGLSMNQWAQKTDWPVIAFLSEVLQRDDVDAEAWFKEFTEISPAQLRSVLLAYWHSSTGSATATLEHLAQDAPFRQRMWIGSLMKLTPVPFCEMPLVGPGNLDIWWSCFAASGNVAPLNRIVDALGAVAHPEGTPMNAVGVSALWSLKSQAQKHVVVADHLRSLLPGISDEGMKILVESALEPPEQPSPNDE